mgnify:CR=1 FL=1
MPDDTYQPANHRRQGGEVWVIGGSIQIAAGGAIVDETGTQAGAIEDVTESPPTVETLAATVNSILAALRGVGIVAED